MLSPISSRSCSSDHSWARGHILLLLKSPGRSTQPGHTRSFQVAGCWLLTKIRPCSLSPPQIDSCRESLKYKTMPFWPHRNFLSSGSLYHPPRESYCHNQCSHGWKRPPGMQRLTVSREGPGIKGLCRV